MAGLVDITWSQINPPPSKKETLVSYKISIRKYYDEHKDEICRDYTNWLEEKLYNNNIPEEKK